MKRLLSACAVMLLAATSVRASMPDTLATPVSVSEQAPTSMLVRAQYYRPITYRCWVNDTAGNAWYGIHQNLRTARALAMAACKGNYAYAAVCYQVPGPCEELRF